MPHHSPSLWVGMVHSKDKENHSTGVRLTGILTEALSAPPPFNEPAQVVSQLSQISEGVCSRNPLSQSAAVTALPWGTKKSVHKIG